MNKTDTSLSKTKTESKLKTNNFNMRTQLSPIKRDHNNNENSRLSKNSPIKKEHKSNRLKSNDRNEKKFGKTNENFSKNIKTTEKIDKKFGKTTSSNFKKSNSTSEGFQQVNLPKNINPFYHILSDKVMCQKGVEFVLELREYAEIPKGKDDKSSNAAPPGFYNDDIKKLQDKSSKALLTTSSKFKDTEYGNLDIHYKTNSIDIDHLCRKRFGESGNFSQIYFETTMRQSKYLNKTNSKNSNQWKSIPYSPTRPVTSDYIPPLRETSKHNLFSHENVNNRDYDVVHNVKIYLNYLFYLFYIVGN